MLGDREERYCDSGGLGMLIGIDPLQSWSYSAVDGLRNIANDPEYIEKMRRAMYEEAVHATERRRKSALYLIKQQPFYGNGD